MNTWRAWSVPAIGDALHLHDDEPAGIARRHGHGQVSRVRASFSMVTLPSISAVVPRRNATSMGKVL
jgi:hypothetical protein